MDEFEVSVISPLSFSERRRGLKVDVRMVELRLGGPFPLLRANSRGRASGQAAMREAEEEKSTWHHSRPGARLRR